jgi:hypothetical protein
MCPATAQIGEILVRSDKDGKAKLAVLGVGGFLGMGEHNVADTNKSVRKNYPDHAVFNATKDQLKAMPQFKYGQ